MAAKKSAIVSADLLTDDLMTLIGAAPVAEPEAATAAPKAKAEKPKAAKTAKAAPVAETEAVEVMFHGFAVNDGADLTVLENALASVKVSITTLADKDSELLNDYLSLGGFLSEVSKEFKSPKLFGQFVAKELPESQRLDSAVRSNSKWVWESLNMPGHEGSNLLHILGVWTGANNPVDDLAKFKSAHPSMIRNAWRDETKRLALAAKLGVDAEDSEALSNAEKADKVAAKAKAQSEAIANAAALTLAIEFLFSNLGALPKGKILAELKPMLTTALMGGAEGVAAELLKIHGLHLDAQNEEEEELEAA